MSCQWAGSRLSTTARASPESSNLPAPRPEFFHRPELIGIAGNIVSAVGLVVPRVRRILVEVTGQMNHHVSTACLPCEVVTIARQRVTIEAEANPHRRFPMPAP
jgi:hypothetical protein